MTVSSATADARPSGTMVSPQPQTTSCGLRGNLGRYSLDSPPPAAHVSSDPEIVNKRFGWVKIISPEKRWNKTKNHCYVLVECQGCGRIRWTLLENLRAGKSKGCQSCSQPRRIPIWLDKRLTAAKQRCTNPNDAAFPHYGGRGIQFRFKNVTDAGLYMIRTLGLPDREMEIDRINTNGDYAPGNLRWATRKQNCANRRITVLSRFDQNYWPYAETTTRRKLAEGLTREEIIQDAEIAVFEHRKNWKGIAARLKSMTFEMPADVTVLPYRTCSSTTADMAEALAP